MAELKTKLQKHQRRVHRKLKKSRGVIVAHRMGAGKTLTAIGAGVESPHKLEVIAPAPLVANFEKEVKVCLLLYLC